MSPHSNSRSSSTASQEGAISRKNSETIIKSPLSVQQGSSEPDLMTSPMSYSESREGTDTNASMLARVGLACQVMMDQAMLGTDMTNQVMSDPAVASQVMSDPAVANHVMSDPAVASQVMSDPAVANQVMSDPAVASQVMSDPAVANQVMSDPDVANQVMSDPGVANQVMSESAVANQAILDQIMASKAFLKRAMSGQNRLEQIIMRNQAIYNKPIMASQCPPHPPTTTDHAMEEPVDLNANTVFINQTTSDPAPTVPAIVSQGSVAEENPEQLPSISALLAQLNTPGTSRLAVEVEESMESDGEQEEDGDTSDRTEDEALHRTAGGVRKRTKRFRLTKPKTKRQQRAKKEAVEKMLREEAEEAGFLLDDLQWSPWKQAIRRTLPNKDSWERRSGNHVGARCKRLYEDMSIPAVYEVAVKTPASSTKIPVLASVTGGNTRGHWEANLLSKPKVKAQVDRVLNRGCKLYCRRAPFAGRDLAGVYERCDVKRTSAGRVSTQDAVHELRGLISKVCDYAWRDHYDVDSRTYSHRGLIVDGVKVSD